MEEDRLPFSRDNPRATRDRPPRSAPAAAQRLAPSISERFGAMLREAVGEDRAPTADDVVRCYEDVLSELNFNSKPIITELTIIAGQQIRYAEEIADAICPRILEVPADCKLPSLYLIDSIVKNIGHQYVRIFSTRLPKVFCEAYNQVHDTQQSSMRHLFRTWSQVFPSSVLTKIEDELQFSPTEDKRPFGIMSTRPSKSPSPRPSHVIHVNPKYLEAQRQFGQSSVMHAADTHSTALEFDYEVEQLDGLASENPEAWSGATSKLHGMPHIRVSSSSQVNGQKPSASYSEYDFDLPEFLPQHLAITGAGPPRTAMVRASSMTGAGGSMPFSKEKISLPSSPPRVGLGRPVSPPNVRFHSGTSARRIDGRASPSHSGFEYGLGRVSDPNVWADGSRPSNEAAQHTEASMPYKLKNGYGKQHPRDLIDAYGNPRGRVSSYEKFPKVQRLDVNGISSEAAARKWKNSDEEEYDWEDMSPTLADQSRRNSLPPFRPSAGSFSTQAGLSKSKPAELDSDFLRRSWPGQTQDRAANDPSFIVENRIASLGRYPGSMMKYLDGTANQSESLPHYHNSNHTRDSGKLSYIFPQSTQQSLSPRSHKRAAQMPLAFRGMTPSTGQRLPIAHDSSLDIELPLRGLSNAHADPLKVDTSMMDRLSTKRPRSPASDMLPPIRKSQPLPSLPIAPNQKPINGPLDILEPKKPMVNQGAQPSLFVPEQQYVIPDRKNSDMVKLLHLPYQPPGIPHLNQQSQEQGVPMPIQSPETHRSIPPPAPVQGSSYSVSQPLNHLQTVGTGVVMASVLPSSSFVSPSVAVHGTTNALLHLHGGLLPPLPPGPPTASSQMGLSRNMSSSMCSTLASPFSGIISTLMEQGLISLRPPTQPQDSLGVEFDLELLKVRHEPAINALYADLPRQCATCGLRFKGQEEHSSHMDWHVTKNRISKNRKQKPSRKWFVSAKEWLSGAEILGNDVVPGFLPAEPIAEKKEDKEMAVPADENQNVCALCGEPFEDFYSDEAEEWMYKGAVYLNAPDGYIDGLDRSQLGPIVHAKCRSESNECAGQA